MRKTESLLSNSLLETKEIAKELSTTLPPGSVVAFFGDLAVGKTTFIKALVAKLASISEDLISSPTFVYLNIYDTLKHPIYHFDLYRLHSESEFLSMGFQEYFDAGGICLIEWSERIENLLPDNALKIILEHAGEDKRLITFS